MNTRPDQSTFFVAVPWHLPLLHPKTYREWFSVKVPGDAPRLRVTFDRLVEPGIELGTRTNCMYYQPSSSASVTAFSQHQFLNIEVHQEQTSTLY